MAPQFTSSLWCLPQSSSTYYNAYPNPTSLPSQTPWNSNDYSHHAYIPATPDYFYDGATTWEPSAGEYWSHWSSHHEEVQDSKPRSLPRSPVYSDSLPGIQPVSARSPQVSIPNVVASTAASSSNPASNVGTTQNQTNTENVGMAVCSTGLSCLERPMRPNRVLGGIVDVDGSDGGGDREIERDQRNCSKELRELYRDESFIQKQHLEVYRQHLRSDFTNATLKAISKQGTSSLKSNPQLEEGAAFDIDGLSKSQFELLGEAGGNGDAVAGTVNQQCPLPFCCKTFTDAKRDLSRSYRSTTDVCHGGNEQERLLKQTDKCSSGKVWGLQDSGSTVPNHSTESKFGSEHATNHLNMAVEGTSIGCLRKGRECDVGDWQGGKKSMGASCNANNTSADNYSTPDISSSTACQTMISTIQNLSEVLAKMLTRPSNSASDLYIHALQNSICILSHCLLKQSGPAVKITRSVTESDFARKANYNVEKKAEGHKTSHVQGCNCAEPQGLQALHSLGFHSELENAGDTFTDAAEELSTKPKVALTEQSCIQAAGRGAHLLKKHQGHLNYSSMQAYLDVSQKELAQLQAMFMKLQEEVSYERSESTAVNAMHKNLWKQAEEDLVSFTSKIKETKLELEGLKQTLKEQRFSGCAISQENVKGVEHDYINKQPITITSVSKSTERMVEDNGELSFLTNLGEKLQEFGDGEDEVALLGHCSCSTDVEENCKLSLKKKQMMPRSPLLQARTSEIAFGNSENTRESECRMSVPSSYVKDNMLLRFRLLQERQEMASSNNNNGSCTRICTWMPLKNDIAIRDRADLSDDDKGEEFMGPEPVVEGHKVGPLLQSQAENSYQADSNLSSCFESQDASSTMTEIPTREERDLSGSPLFCK